MGFSEVSIKRNPATELGAIAFLFSSGSIRECGRRAPEQDMTPPERLSELGRLRQKRLRSATIVTLRTCSKQFWALQVPISSDIRVNTPHKRVGNNVLVRYPFSPVSKSRGASTFSAQANLHSATHSSARPPRNQATLLCRQIDIRSTVRTTSLEVASFKRCLIHWGYVSRSSLSSVLVILPSSSFSQAVSVATPPSALVVVRFR